MKLTLRIMMALAVVAMLFTGCTSKEEVNAIAKDRDTLLAEAAQSNAALQATIESMKAQNDDLRQQLQGIVSKASQQDKDLDELSFQIRKMQEVVTGTKARIDSEKARSGKGGGWWWTILGILAILAILVALYMIFRPKPFDEEEDEDMGFDDDFNFEDEDEEKDEEDSGEKKP